MVKKVRIAWNKGKKCPSMSIAAKKRPMLVAGWNKGKKWSKETREKISKAQKGRKYPDRWKSWGKKIYKEGYIMVYNPNHPGAHCQYVLEHRVIMEKHIGRYLKKGEMIHHKNGKRDDNRLDNLQIVNHEEHRTLHAKLRKKQIKPCIYCNKDFLSYYGKMCPDCHKKRQREVSGRCIKKRMAIPGERDKLNARVRERNRLKKLSQI